MASRRRCAAQLGSPHSGRPVRIIAVCYRIHGAPAKVYLRAVSIFPFAGNASTAMLGSDTTV